MSLPLDDLIQKSVTDTTLANMAAIVPQVWASELEPNLRKREVFQQSIVVNTDLVGAEGDRVFLPTLPDIGAANDLTESTPMNVIALTAATSVQLTPAEKGQAVGISRKALDRMKYDGIAQIVDRLAYSMSLKIEGAIAGLWNATVPGSGGSMVVRYPNGHASGSLVAGDVMTSGLLRDAIAMLKSSDVMPFDDGMWMLFLHPKQVRDLLADTEVRNDLRYAQPEVLLRGEVGVYNNCHIISTTHTKIVGEGVGAAVNGYKAMLVSPRWAAVAYKRTPALVVDPTVYDFGRRRQVGIVADFDIELIHADRGIVITTASSLG